MSEENTEVTTEVTTPNPAPENQEQPPQHTPQPSEAEQQLNSRIASLESSVSAKIAELAEARKMVDAQAADCAALKASHDDAIKAYRRLAASSNPLFSEELIGGTTIAEIDASMAKIADLVSKVRSRVEADIQAAIVPAGAPQRSAPDISNLSPRDKIKLALEENK